MSDTSGPDLPPPPATPEASAADEAVAAPEAAVESAAEAPPEASPPQGRVRLRRIAVAALVVLTTIAIFASILSIWSYRQVLNTDVFVSRVDSTLDDPDVQAGLATYLTNEVMGVLNAEALAKEYLPPVAQPLVGPLTAAIRNFVQDKTHEVLASDAFQDFLSGAVRRAHAAAVGLLEGDTVRGFEIQGDSVVLNTLPLIQRVLDRVNEAGLFGGRLQLPPVSDEGGNPSEQIQQLAERLNRELPPDFGQITVFSSDALEEAQQALKIVRKGIIVLLIVTLVLLVATILLSTNRWRTAAQLGIGLAIAMLVMVFVARYIDRWIRDQIANPDAAPAAGALTRVFTSSLESVATLLLVLGVVVALIGFFFGRSDSAAKVRAAAARSAARAGGAVAEGSPATGFVVAHASAFRVGAIVVGALILWWSGFSVSGAIVALIVAAVLLLIVELLIRRAGSRLPAT